MNKIRIGDLSVGDWVQDKKGSIAQIIGIENWSDGYVLNVRINGIDVGCVSANAIEPIPLTQEILEKNGFATRDERYYTFNADEARVDIEKMEDGYEIATFRVLPTGGIITKMICPISSVHQLQHALRLAGNEKEIEL